MMMRVPQGSLQQEIDHARQLLKPTAVRLRHIPRWFGLCLKPFRRQYGSTISALDEMRIRLDAHWLDHWGSTLLVRRHVGREDVTSETVFVSEPYGFLPQYASSLDELARQTGVRWSVEANSWHYPGHTVRIVLEPPPAAKRESSAADLCGPLRLPNTRHGSRPMMPSSFSPDDTELVLAGPLEPRATRG